MKIPQFGLKRPVTTVMVLVSLLIVGAVATFHIPLRLLPAGLDPPFLGIWMRYPNSSPEENARLITKPLEEYLWTVRGVKQIRSRSDRERCGIWIEFYGETDMDVAYLEVRDRIERARRELPSDLRYIYLRRFGDNEQPVMWFNVLVNQNVEDPYRLIQDEIVLPLQRVDGVAAVETWGGDPKQVQITLLMDKLKQYRLEVREVVRALQRADFAISGGWIYEGGLQYLVKSKGRILSLEELVDLPVARLKPSLGAVNAAYRADNTPPAASLPPLIHLKDIAEVTYSQPRKERFQRMDGYESVEVEVFKESEANTVSLCRELNRTLEELRQNPKLQGFNFELLFDEGYYIRRSLNNLLQAGLWGGLFAFFVLFYFLRQILPTVFVSAAIPLSLLTTLIFLYFSGWSLNVITLSGMMISVGMVVDNAIVVTENIFSYRQRGMSAREAAITGANQVSLAITLATATTMVVFLPIMVLGGNRIFSFYVIRLGMPVIIALGASLIIALLFIPLATYYFSSNERIHQPAGKNTLLSTLRHFINYGEGSRTVSRWADRIERWVRWSLDNRSYVITAAVILLTTTAIPISRVIKVDEEEGHINDINLRFSFPAYYSLSQIDSLLTNLETQIRTHEQRYKLKTISTRFRRGFARMTIFLKPDEENNWLQVIKNRVQLLFTPPDQRPLSRNQVVKELKEQLTLPPGVEMFTSWRQGSRDENVVYVNIYGEDGRVLEQIGEEIKQRLSLLSEVLTMENDPASSSEELTIEFNREESTRHQINPTTTSYGLSAMVRGIDLGEIWLEKVGAQVPVRFQLREQDRRGLEQILNLPVVGERGEVLRLGDVSSPRFQRAPSEVGREDRRQRLAIRITTTEPDVKKFGRKLEQALADLKLPPNYEWTKGRRFFDVEEQGRQQMTAWLMAALFVMLLMSALFESILLPWAVIITVPFSFFGVWWLFYITGTEFGVMAAIGVIILIGVVVNNAIVLVDRINQLRTEGLTREDAVCLGARQRFRPIVMTALTTILGLTPMALGDTSLLGIPYAPLGRALIGGLVTATITTPILVPILYTYLDDLRIGLKRMMDLFIAMGKVKNV